MSPNEGEEILQHLKGRSPRELLRSASAQKPPAQKQCPLDAPP